MDIIGMSKEGRLGMMRRRQAYFAAVAEEYNTFDEFIKSQEMRLAIMGIQLTRSGEYLELYIQLDFTEYEHCGLSSRLLLSQEKIPCLEKGST